MEISTKLSEESFVQNFTDKCCIIKLPSASPALLDTASLSLVVRKRVAKPRTSPDAHDQNDERRDKKLTRSTIIVVQ